MVDNCFVFCGVYKMKLKDGLILQEVAGQYVVVPTGKRVNEIPGIVYISSSEVNLWNYMKDHEFEREDLINLAVKEHDGMAREKALADIDNFLEKLINNNIIDGVVERGELPKEILERLLKEHK